MSTPEKLYCGINECYDKEVYAGEDPFYRVVEKRIGTNSWAHLRNYGDKTAYNSTDSLLPGQSSDVE